MLAGLIHDIGVLPILTMAENYPALLEDEAALDSLIDTAHVELGTAILKSWDFPPPVIEAVSHHDDLGYSSGAKPSYADLVIVANLLSAQNLDKFSSILIEQVPAFTQLGMEDLLMEQMGYRQQAPAEPWAACVN